MPGPIPPEPDVDLPPGVEVPPGNYQVSISLGEADKKTTEDTVDVTVMGDPRLAVSAGQRAEHYQSMLALQELQAATVSAVEFIVHSRSDLDTVDRLIAQQTDAAKNAGEDDPRLEKLTEQSAKLRKSLDALEARFRVAPERRGSVYADDRVDSRIGLAQTYVGSSPGAESPAASAYLKLAEQSLASAQEEMSSFWRQASSLLSAAP